MNAEMLSVETEVWILFQAFSFSKIFSMCLVTIYAQGYTSLMTDMYNLMSNMHYETCYANSALEWHMQLLCKGK